MILVKLETWVCTGLESDGRVQACVLTLLIYIKQPLPEPQVRGEFHKPPAHTSLACEAMAARALALGAEGARCQFWVGSRLFPANFEYTSCLD